MASITITWRRRSFDNVGQRVYRSTSPIDPENLPTPLATLAKDVERYTDETVLLNVTYYYAISAFNATGEKISASMATSTNQTARGHGPSTLIDHNDTAGFFGLVPQSQFITYADLRGAMGTSGNFNVGDWLKFYLDGKILFWANNAVATMNQETSLKLKLATGEREITINSYRYRVRHMSGVGTAPVVQSNIYKDPDWTHGSEWNRLLYNVTEDTDKLSQVGLNWANYTLSQMSFTYDANIYINESDTIQYVRGNSSVTNVTSFTSPTATHRWRPVLELITD